MTGDNLRLSLRKARANLAHPRQDSTAQEQPEKSYNRSFHRINAYENDFHFTAMDTYLVLK
ncbi:hypothetical protein AM10699_62810 (plasmid) [Acaryochloris marina MBIC10699]|nr:hypothetical protein AM10699_62810 [Acaryochloris marina MBIC10699]